MSKYLRTIHARCAKGSRIRGIATELRVAPVGMSCKAQNLREKSGASHGLRKMIIPQCLEGLEPVAWQALRALTALTLTAPTDANCATNVRHHVLQLDLCTSLGSQELLWSFAAVHLDTNPSMVKRQWVEVLAKADTRVTQSVEHASPSALCKVQTFLLNTTAQSLVAQHIYYAIFQRFIVLIRPAFPVALCDRP